MYEGIRPNLIKPRVLKIERGFHVKMGFTGSYCSIRFQRNHFLSEKMQWNYSMLPLIISCTRSWNFAWHLHTPTESKSIAKLLAISQTIHTVCCENDYFPKGIFKLFNTVVCFTQCTLFFQKYCFLLPICLPCVICGSYARDHGILRDISFGARELRSKTLSNSWQ